MIEPILKQFNGARQLLLLDASFSKPKILVKIPMGHIQQGRKLSKVSL